MSDNFTVIRGGKAEAGGNEATSAWCAQLKFNRRRLNSMWRGSHRAQGRDELQDLQTFARASSRRRDDMTPALGGDESFPVTPRLRIDNENGQAMSLPERQM